MMTSLAMLDTPYYQIFYEIRSGLHINKATLPDHTLPASGWWDINLKTRLKDIFSEIDGRMYNATCLDGKSMLGRYTNYVWEVTEADLQELINSNG